MLLTGCGTVGYSVLGSFFGSDDKPNYSPATEGGNASVSFREDGSISRVFFNQPENATNESKIVVQSGEGKSITVTVGSSSLPEFNEISSENWTYVTWIGCAAIAIGIFFFAISFTNLGLKWLIGWKFGASIIGAGLGVVLASFFLQKYAVWTIALIVAVVAIWYIDQRGTRKPRPTHIKVSQEKKEKELEKYGL